LVGICQAAFFMNRGPVVGLIGRHTPLTFTNTPGMTEAYVV
jgi:hypothetical protein